MKKNKRVISPIASFNYHLENYNGLIKSFRKNNDVSHIGSMLKDCFTSELTTQINQEDYDALVLTDTSQNILWVNDGFKNMTGYTKKFAIGKRPSFLQGEKTSTSIKKELRDKLAFNHTYSGSIINYRKNGELYLCKITILPIYNLDEKLKYYMAIEKDETKMNRSTWHLDS
jgi:PAS domain S-box-containing protein